MHLLQYLFIFVHCFFMLVYSVLMLTNIKLLILIMLVNVEMNFYSIY